jgi:hypothetical protein
LYSLVLNFLSFRKKSNSQPKKNKITDLPVVGTTSSSSSSTNSTSSTSNTSSSSSSSSVGGGITTTNSSSSSGPTPLSPQPAIVPHLSPRTPLPVTISKTPKDIKTIYAERILDLFTTRFSQLKNGTFQNNTTVMQ